MLTSLQKSKGYPSITPRQCSGHSQRAANNRERRDRTALTIYPATAKNRLLLVC